MAFLEVPLPSGVSVSHEPLPDGDFRGTVFLRGYQPPSTTNLPTTGPGAPAGSHVGRTAGASVGRAAAAAGEQGCVSSERACCFALHPEQLRVIGIDDWAWRCGRRYGTLICDLERRRIVDPPDRYEKSPAMTDAEILATGGGQTVGQCLRVLSDWVCRGQAAPVLFRIVSPPWVTRFSSRSTLGRRMMGSGERGVSICFTTLQACALRLWTLNEIAWPIVPTGTIRFALSGAFVVFCPPELFQTAARPASAPGSLPVDRRGISTPYRG